MQGFHNILFVSHGVKEETEALQLAIKLASENEAQLRILIACPPFPDTLSEYKISMVVKEQQIIGNTAENILQKIDCSLLALKPLGFVSPVKAY